MLDSNDVRAALGDPFVQTGCMALAGGLFTQGLLRNYPQRRLIGQLAFFAALTTLLFYHGIVPYDAVPAGLPALQRFFSGLVKIMWWTTAAWSLTGFVRVFLIFDGQPREGRLLQDLVVGVIYVGAMLCIVAYVFNAPVGTLIATSGVLAIILGLALQSTLSDVFSGIALSLGRPYGIGDRIAFGDGIEGLVVETNWRATHLLNGVNDLVIVPNSDLAKARLTNLSSPERSHGAKVVVRLAPTTSPAEMARVMRTALLSGTTILPVPPATVQIKAMDAVAVELELWFRVADVTQVGAAQNEIFDLVFRHALANGLTLASPPGSPMHGLAVEDGEHKADNRPTPLRMLEALPLFAALSDEERGALAATVTRRSYAKGDVVAAQDTMLQSLMIVRKGVVSVTRHEQGREVELGRLAPGDCFGERGLLAGAGETATIRALTRVVVYEIGKDGLGPLIRDRPALAEELAAILARRAEHEKHMFGHDGEAVEMRSVPRLVSQIRQLFGLVS